MTAVKVDKVEKNKSGGFTLFGKIMDGEPSSVIITVLDDVMIGSVAHGNDNYTIRYFGGNIHEIAQTGSFQFPGMQRTPSFYEILFRQKNIRD